MTLKEQCVHFQIFVVIQHATRAVGDWVSCAPNKRPHQPLATKTPDQAYALAGLDFAGAAESTHRRTHLQIKRSRCCWVFTSLPCRSFFYRPVGVRHTLCNRLITWNVILEYSIVGIFEREWMDAVEFDFKIANLRQELWREIVLFDDGGL